MTYATDVSPIVFDLETAGLPNAANFLDPVEPDKRLTDPVKIAASVAEREQARAEKFGLECRAHCGVGLLDRPRRDPG